VCSSDLFKVLFPACVLDREQRAANTLGLVANGHADPFRSRVESDKPSGGRKF